MTHRDHSLLPNPRERTWRSRGLTRAQERLFTVLAVVVVVAMVGAWAWSVYRTVTEVPAPSSGTENVARATVSSSILDPSGPKLAFLNELALRTTEPMRGLSGELMAGFYVPGEELNDLTGLDPEVELAFEDPRGREIASGVYTAPDLPGIYRLAFGIDRFRQAVEDFSIITEVPFSTKREGRIGEYMLGNWPYEDGGTPKSPAYRNPEGFIEVTPDNIDTKVSTHFRLGDFLTKGQSDVWPKYLLLNPKLIDKLELTIQELESQGVEIEKVHVMSGFRHPYYNYGGGNTQGRANLSRHMYGDAADIFVDNDGDAWSDDVTGDGKLTLADAEKIADAADAVERKHPSLAGGIGIYPACCGHGPMVHIDTRGYRARWVY